MFKKLAAALSLSGCLAYGSLWFGGLLGPDDTFFEDESVYRDRDSLWIEGVSKRVFLGYMLEQALLRCSFSMEWSWDQFSHRLGRAQSLTEASYDLTRDWSFVIRPGIRLGDGFIHIVLATEHAQLNETINEYAVVHQQKVDLFPYNHLGAGLSFAIAPQTELMAEVRFSQEVSKNLYAYVLNKNLPEALPSSYTLHNTQLMFGVSYAL